MWHVAEGELHAYLDGALEEYPADEARRVREHLETCAACGARLEEERRVREEARGILGLVAPDVEVPTFEELRAFVRANPSSVSIISVRLYRLSWAASVVLALGTGWMLRGARVDPLMSPRAPAPTAERTSGAATPDGEALRERELEQSARRGNAADARPAAAPPVGGRLEAFEERDLSAGGGGTAADASRPAEPAEARSDVAPQIPVATPPAVAGDAGFALGDAVAEAVEEVAPVGLQAPVEAQVPTRVQAPARLRALESARTEPSPEVDALASRQEVADDLPADSDAGRARRAAADQRMAAAISAEPTAGALADGGRSAAPSAPTSTDEETVSLVVPGLEVLDVLPVGQGTTFAGMRALQRLESGDTLELVHLPATVDPSSLPALREGWREIVRQRGTGWVVLRAPLPEPSLEELLQRLDTGR